MAKAFSDNFYSFNSQYQHINHNISHECKQIENASKKLAKHYFKLSVELDALQRLVLQRTEIPQFSNLYQRMSDLVHINGELALHQGFMINDSLNSHFKYQREQGRISFQEAYLLVEGAQFKFEKAQRVLDAEKVKLFKKQNYEAWQIQDPAIIKEVYKVRNNFNEAKMFMLPEKT